MQPQLLQPPSALTYPLPPPCSLQLNELNRKLQSGAVELPPEGERSPSPPPVYDVMGMRSVAGTCTDLPTCLLACCWRCRQLAAAVCHRFCCRRCLQPFLLSSAARPGHGTHQAAWMRCKWRPVRPLSLLSAPIYCRLNTREVRYKEKMQKQRNKMIEQLLARDPTYKPPTGGCWAGR